MYCLFCDVPCVVCVNMCTEQLPPGGYPIAVKYYIYISLLLEGLCVAQHVSDGLSVRHQESKTVHTTSGICHTGSVAAC